MALTVRQKKKAARKVVELFIREGKVLDPKEWAALKDKPFNGATLRRVLGSWNRMLARVKAAEPQKWALIGKITDDKKSSVAVKKESIVNVARDKLAILAAKVVKDSKKNPESEKLNG